MAGDKVTASSSNEVSVLDKIFTPATNKQTYEQHLLDCVGLRWYHMFSEKKHFRRFKYCE